MSLGFQNSAKESDELLRAAYNKGIILIGASGNQGKDQLEYPARSPYVISAGAIDSNYKRWNYSNYGKELDFVLPGESIYIMNSLEDGTSFSTAILTAIVTRLVEEYPGFNQSYIFNKLKKMSNNKNKVNEKVGYGTPSF
jgi:hypothetical protein